MLFKAIASAIVAIGLLAAVPDPIITKVIVNGDPGVPIEKIAPHLSARPGMRYTDAVRTSDAESARQFYVSQHMALGKINVAMDPANSTLTYSIYVARVGALRINDASARGLLQLRPGMIVTTGRVEADVARLRKSGKYKNVNVDTVRGPNPDMSQHVTLVWTVNR